MMQFQLGIDRDMKNLIVKIVQNECTSVVLAYSVKESDSQLVIVSTGSIITIDKLPNTSVTVYFPESTQILTNYKY